MNTSFFWFLVLFLLCSPPLSPFVLRNRTPREETEHRSAVRQMPAFHTVATLCQLASECGIGGQPSPVAVLRDTTLAPLDSFQAQERPEKKGKGKGRAYRQVFFVVVGFFQEIYHPVVVLVFGWHQHLLWCTCACRNYWAQSVVLQW